MKPNIIKLGLAHIHDLVLMVKPVWFHTYMPILSEEQVAFMFDSIYNYAAIEKQMTDGQEFFGYFEDKKLIGIISASPQSKYCYKVNKLYVDNSTSTKGIGTKLLNYIEVMLKEVYVNEIIINVNRFNPALFFYLKRGYTILHSEDIPIGPYWMNDYVVYKSLASK